MFMIELILKYVVWFCNQLSDLSSACATISCTDWYLY